MSTTIGDLVDRTLREYLEPVDSVESYSYLTGDVSTTTQSTINYEEGMFSTEEEDALGAGAIIEGLLIFKILKKLQKKLD